MNVMLSANFIFSKTKKKVKALLFRHALYAYMSVSLSVSMQHEHENEHKHKHVHPDGRGMDIDISSWFGHCHTLNGVHQAYCPPVVLSLPFPLPFPQRAPPYILTYSTQVRSGDTYNPDGVDIQKNGIATTIYY
jgi:hypothetical protein